uniref:Pickpocket protein 28-like isoform X1 n=1 Tax=Diabrotica virgifera virgifera TaxID=50390 RepID=A0A6P7F803_DIAVI
MYYFIKYKSPTGEEMQRFTRLQKIFDKKKITAEEVLRKLSPSCEMMFAKCLWKGLSVKCSHLFQQTKTSEGFCCTFNSHVFKNTSIYEKTAHKYSSTPQRLSTCGSTTGLITLINNDVEDYYAAYVPSFGHRIRISNPYQYSDWNAMNILIATRRVHIVAITPQYTAASEEIRELPLSERQCLYPDEKDLIYFKIYNFRSCLVECRMNITREICKCTPHNYLPDNGRDPSVKVCNLLDIPRLAKINGKIRSSVPGLNGKEILGSMSEKYYKDQCGCYPDCTLTLYQAKDSSYTLLRNNSLYSPYLYNGIGIKDHSLMKIYFGNSAGVKSRRQRTYTWYNLLAFYGGILGILMGCSIVCLTQIVYYVLKRIMIYIMGCKIEKNGKKGFLPYTKKYPLFPYTE